MAPPPQSAPPGRYPTDDKLFVTFPSRRSVVHSTRAIVSTTSPLATEAGLRILREGGNAADAAVAAAAVLNLVDPSMTGIGGDVFALCYDARSRQVHALNGSGRSPASATLDDVCRALGVADGAGGKIPTTSALSVTVPGAAAAWVDLVERFGSGQVTLAQALAPAIEMADQGAPISEISGYLWASAEAELLDKANGVDLLKPDPSAPRGFRAPRPGEICRNPLLARTLRRLADDGKPGFYEGPVAQAIVDVIASQGGYMTLEDLKRHADLGSELTEAVPLRLDDRVVSHGGAVDFWEHPPNGQGVVAQIALGILQQLRTDGKVPAFGLQDHNSVPYLHAVIQALRIAFADATWYVADPDSAPIDAQALIAPTYLANRASLFDPTTATPPPPHGYPTPRTSDTVYLAVVDAHGNACSLVNSVADTFGARVVPAGTGFVLHNRGAGFHLDSRRPNAYAPGKRPYNTIIPALVTHADDASGKKEAGGALHTVLGVMGGAVQPQAHVQVLLNMLLFGMNPQVALDAPRVCVGINIPGKETDATKAVDEAVYLEEGIADQVGRGLEALGYEIKYVAGMGRSLFGRGQVIQVRHDAVTGQRVYSAGSDMRGDGMAAPLV